MDRWKEDRERRRKMKGEDVQPRGCRREKGIPPTEREPRHERMAAVTGVRGRRPHV